MLREKTGKSKEIISHEMVNFFYMFELWKETVFFDNMKT